MTDSEQETEVFFNPPRREDEDQHPLECDDNPSILMNQNEVCSNSPQQKQHENLYIAEEIKKLCVRQDEMVSVLQSITQILRNYTKQNDEDRHIPTINSSIPQEQIRSNYNDSRHMEQDRNKFRSQRTVQQHRRGSRDSSNEEACRGPARSYNDGNQFSVHSRTYRREEHNFTDDRVNRDFHSFGPGGMRQDSYPQKTVKIPAFYGKEDWRVWISRFEAIADRHGWTSDDRLDELLPKLQGSAGDFVFTQLRREMLNDYQTLIAELDSRYRVVETTKTFAAKFTRRNQKQNETAEEYAAELKYLYDKAHRRRDLQTRREDLVRRFLDGLWDEEVRTEVEYVKDPSDIDEAVFHVVNYIQMRQRHSHGPYSQKKQKIFIRSTKSEDTPEDSEEEEYVRQVKPKYKESKNNNTSHSNSTAAKQSENKESQEPSIAEKMKQLLLKFEQFIQNQEDRQKRRSCFKCHQMGHYIKDCPTNMQNQGQQWNNLLSDPTSGSRNELLDENRIARVRPPVEVEQEIPSEQTCAVRCRSTTRRVAVQTQKHQRYGGNCCLQFAVQKGKSSDGDLQNIIKSQRLISTPEVTKARKKSQ